MFDLIWAILAVVTVATALTLGVRTARLPPIWSVIFIGVIAAPLAFLLAVAGWDAVRLIAIMTVLAVPLAISVGALLDVAARPEWAWALVGRNRVLWLVAILVGIAVVPMGLAISCWYLLRVRPELVAFERGEPFSS